MLDTDPVLRAVTSDIFRESSERTHGEFEAFDDSLWNQLETSGLLLVGLDPSIGGSGGTLQDLAEILLASGRTGARVPVLETYLANALLAASASSLTTHPKAVDLGFDLRNELDVTVGRDGTRVNGQLRAVKWGGTAESLVAVRDSRAGLRVLEIQKTDFEVQPNANLAGEPHDLVLLRETPANVYAVDDPTFNLMRIQQVAALGRALQMVGAMESCLELSIRHSRERRQFGRSIAEFQAVQHLLARVAGGWRASRAIAEFAVRAAESSTSPFCGAAAKICSNVYSLEVYRAAHQIHGAIGFTQEHPLTSFTRRLMAWRDEFGSESFWCRSMSTALRPLDSSGLWELITSWTPEGHRASQTI